MKSPRIIPARELTEVVAELCIKANRELPEDTIQAIRRMKAQEPYPPAREILDRIIENFTLARAEQIPICQDTGLACVFVDLGEEVFIDGNIHEAVDRGVARGYTEGYLRKSSLLDPLRRDVNSGDNSPAVLYLDQVPGDRVKVTVAPKGFGSENMSRIAMLKPSDGREGVIHFVLQTLAEAGPNPCPPVVVGLGIGGTFDKAALLAKKALLRPLDQAQGDPFYAEMEAELLRKINESGTGPQGFGGMTTALKVSIETAPTHIAGLPCAVNLNCHVSRHQSRVI